MRAERSNPGQHVTHWIASSAFGLLAMTVRCGSVVCILIAMNEASTQPTSLASALAARRFVLTAEIAPPLSCDPDDVIKLARPLKGLADAVNVTDGAGARAHMGASAAAAILAPMWEIGRAHV